MAQHVKYTIFFNYLLRLLNIVNAFIVPWMILHAYGSSVNGLLNSITQFLGLIVFVEFGLGAIIPSALYAPLAKKNIIEVSIIIKASQKIFDKIGIVLVCYVFILIICYPFFSCDFNYIFVVSLIIATSLSLFVEYFFGIVNSFLLNADCKGWVPAIVQSGVLIINIVLCYFLIEAKFNIVFVKFMMAFVLSIKPIILYFYVRTHYNLVDCNEKFVLHNKMAGFCQHLEFVFSQSGPVVVLTLFCSYIVVSVFSVYNIILNGIKSLFIPISVGVEPILGRYWAENKILEFKRTMEIYQFVMHLSATIVFTVASITMVPFVKIYVTNIDNYFVYSNQILAFMCCLSGYLYCIRQFYHSLVLVTSEYAKTKNIYIISFMIDLVMLTIFVWKFGLAGGVAGQICAVIFQILSLNYFFIKKDKVYDCVHLVKYSIIDVFIFVIFMTIATYFDFKVSTESFVFWAIDAFRYTIIVCVISFAINFVLNGKKIYLLIKK